MWAILAMAWMGCGTNQSSEADPESDPEPKAADEAEDPASEVPAFFGTGFLPRPEKSTKEAYDAAMGDLPAKLEALRGQGTPHREVLPDPPLPVPAGIPVPLRFRVAPLLWPGTVTFAPSEAEPVVTDRSEEDPVDRRILTESPVWIERHEGSDVPAWAAFWVDDEGEGHGRAWTWHEEVLVGFDPEGRVTDVLVDRKGTLGGEAAGFKACWKVHWAESGQVKGIEEWMKMMGRDGYAYVTLEPQLQLNPDREAP